MMGNKHTKNQHKLRNRLYRKVSRKRSEGDEGGARRIGEVGFIGGREPF